MNAVQQLKASTVSAKNQMKFQERMSNTAHQREVADLKAAGLNPVLSAGGSGASTPSGAAGDYDLSDLSGIIHESVKAINNSAKALAKVAGSGSGRGSSSSNSDQGNGINTAGALDKTNYVNNPLALGFAFVKDAIDGLSGKTLSQVTSEGFKGIFDTLYHLPSVVSGKGAYKAWKDESQSNNWDKLRIGYVPYTEEEKAKHDKFVKDNSFMNDLGAFLAPFIESASSAFQTLKKFGKAAYASYVKGMSKRR